MTGATPSGSGCQPTASAADASSQSGIPSVIVLVRDDDPSRKPLLYACGKCGTVHSPRIYMATDEVSHATARQAAEDCYTCKTNNVCACGAECPKYWTTCGDCQFKKNLAEAEEIPDDGGPYCSFGGDTYYQELEYAADDGCEWVSPCHISYPKIDADNIIDSLVTDMHDDADVDDLVGVDALYAAVAAFNEAQTMQSWLGDSKRKIRVPSQGIDARSGQTEGLAPKGESPVSEGNAPERTVP